MGHRRRAVRSVGGVLLHPKLSHLLLLSPVCPEIGSEGRDVQFRFHFHGLRRVLWQSLIVISVHFVASSPLAMNRQKNNYESLYKLLIRVLKKVVNIICVEL